MAADGLSGAPFAVHHQPKAVRARKGATGSETRP